MFKNLTKAVLGIAALPLDVAVDIATLGGALTDGGSSAAKRIKHIADNIDEVTK